MVSASAAYLTKPHQKAADPPSPRSTTVLQRPRESTMIVAVAVMHQAASAQRRRSSRGLLQRIEHDVLMRGTRRTPAADTPRIGIDHEADVD